MTAGLKGFNKVSDYTLNSEIQDSLVEYFDWGLLEKENYFNVDYGELSVDGYDMSVLRPSADDGDVLASVWNGFKKNWVWQSIMSDNPPYTSNDSSKPGILGITVNGVFYPSDVTGKYAHKVDYTNGRVLFLNAIDVSSEVQVEYSYKIVNVIYSSEVPWIRQIQSGTLDGPDPSFFLNRQGDTTQEPENRVQTPFIAVEIVPQRRFKGYQLGGGQIVYTDVLFHCVADTDIMRDKLVDIVSFQNDKSVDMFNSNKVNAANDFPLDHIGSPVPNAKNFPELVRAYPGLRMRFTKVRSQSMTMSGELYGATVRMTVETVKRDI